jgi:hypothetical protein
MMFLWIVSGASLLVAVVSWIQVRRAARRLEELSQMYWEVRYELGEVRVQMRRLAGETPAETPDTPERPVVDGFVPLATLKRR